MSGEWSIPPDTTVAELSDVLYEKRAEFDGMSERWQDSERGEAVAEWLDAVEMVCDEYDNVVSSFDELPREVEF
jgi:hypothetical protein